MDIFDCAIIGAGPAGLNAALVLGRARRRVVLFDNDTNRNRVTKAAHGFMTREGVKPAELRQLALAELGQFPSVSVHKRTVEQISKANGGEQVFQIMSANKQIFLAKKILLAAGVHEKFPKITNIREFYGKSLFSCPYCDGWENRGKPLIVIAEKQEHVHHMTKLLYNWSKDLVVTTNGHPMSKEMIEEFQQKQIKVINDQVRLIYGNNGNMAGVEFDSGEKIAREAGFIVPSFYRPKPFVEELGCEVKEDGKIVTDDLGRTTIKSVYSAGEFSHAGPASLIIAAAEGSKAAGAINYDLSDESF
ncbi:thioredoxin reductase [Alkalihalobacillus alcalophilus ATCC 27647 = CGMCC 1.3604]|uniref:Thioredoxin reductase n=1 Tax=Alkalihalobacillus alcalophilus ATCC 27647 = CGMCC 1.3604 TaxID=1218173 RepID=A0A094WEG5_ALKAL|nr:NAD(P)/FAD-dependent oxidoreductase [Alkalihalobacillus alcalophilus]KGA96149.1 thioredoxin reductase [Alkalihalobacillus alcalophilus ATCC 27647 = CGMCC 1.3604]MED1563183.1 NAD(P)/FAD-dependent oxidoreductase [Alkalihalobacillus alcalophilus]THG89283.1 thioredoxin reductase [Alkalihalobacillus alcalophilus ATCC 27647 = CGMCC 1.3604]